MKNLKLQTSILGCDIRYSNDQPCTLYRVREELPRTDSPKPCFAPIYTPNGKLITEYRPSDHTWHTGLYFGWVHVNGANLWGGPWYLKESGKYEHVENTHGVQRHDIFTELSNGPPITMEEQLTWLNGLDEPIAKEKRHYNINKIEYGTHWRIETEIVPVTEMLTLGASRAARYSGLELRMGPPFSDANHYDSEGRQGHKEIMGQRAQWVVAGGNNGACVAMMDHPSNPRHPTTWFARRNLLGAGLLMEEDLSVKHGQSLLLRYDFFVMDLDPGIEYWNDEYMKYSKE